MQLENRGPKAPCCGPLYQTTLGKLAVVPHSAAALLSTLLSAALFLTAGLIVSVLALFLLRG